MKIFIVGGTGLFGSHIIPILKEMGYEVVAPLREQFDVAKDEYLLDRVGDNAFGLQTDVDIVLDSCGYTDVSRAQTPVGSQLAYATNPSVEWLMDLPPWVQIFHMSTDYVYPGDVADSLETDILEPFNVYGISKAMADMKLLSLCQPNIHIIRTSFKPKKWPYRVAFDDMHTNADTVDVIAGMIAEFISLDPPGGVWNIGTGPKTIYELAKRNNPEVLPGSVKDVPFLRPWVTMDLGKYREFIEECRASF